MGNLDLRVGGKYRLKQKIGGGGYGAFYLGLDDDTGEEVAIKLEDESANFPRLDSEVDVYETLAGGAGIPHVHWHGDEGSYEVMVFDLLGPSLEDLFEFCGRKFSLKTVLMIANQLIYRLSYIHSKRIIHRDIKPDNILMGVGRLGNHVYIADMGIATQYRSVEKDYDPLRKPIFIGTASFASVRGHIGVEQSPRDDMESLGYLLLYLLRGSLPWQQFEAPTEKEKLELIREKKETISTEALCDGLPKEFAAYFNHIRPLQYGDKPQYSYLRRTFQNLFSREGFKWDNVFDWSILKYSMAKSSAGDCCNNSM